MKTENHNNFLSLGDSSQEIPKANRTCKSEPDFIVNVLLKRKAPYIGTIMEMQMQLQWHSSSSSTRKKH